MPRKALKPNERRSLPLPDIRYNSILVSRFINKINYRGQKSMAERTVYKAFELIKEKTGEDPIKVFNQAIENARPLLEVKPRRVGGATYQVPVEVPNMRSTSVAMRWIIDAAKNRGNKNFYERLSEEIISAYKKEGGVIKKREDMHKMAESNRAFAHYRW